MFQLDAGDKLSLPRGPREAFRVLANLGAGHLLDITLTEYPTEPELDIECTGGVLDGGNVRLQVGECTDTVLEAAALPALRRRAREAEDADRDDD